MSYIRLDNYGFPFPFRIVGLEDSYSCLDRFALPIKLLESEDKFVIYLDLMGIDKQDCKITLEEKLLTIEIDPNKYKVQGSLVKKYTFNEPINVEKSRVEVETDSIKVFLYKNKDGPTRKILHPK